MMVTSFSSVRTSFTFRLDAGLVPRLSGRTSPPSKRWRRKSTICATFALRSPSKQNRLDRLEHDGCVEHQALVLQIVQVVLQFLLRIFDRGAVWIFDMRPAGQARLNQVPLLVVFDFLSELRYEVRT